MSTAPAVVTLTAQVEAFREAFVDFGRQVSNAMEQIRRHFGEQIEEYKRDPERWNALVALDGAVDDTERHMRQVLWTGRIEARREYDAALDALAARWGLARE